MVLLMAQGLAQPDHVIGLRRVEALRGIRRSLDGGLEIGATVTHAEAERSPAVAAHCPALRTAFGHVATVRIRNQATVGGNLAHADPAQDPPPMLLALGAEVIAASPRGQRRIPLHELFVGFFQTSLEPDEIVTAISLSPPDRRAGAAYLKFLPRTQDDYATVSVAAWLLPDRDGRCARARIALGAAGAVPLRARRAEESLTGRRLDGEAIAEAAALVREEVDPIDDARGPASAGAPAGAGPHHERLFGEPEVRVEGRLKTTGTARYAADVSMPGMLWVAFLTSPVPHARIRSIDVRAAAEVDGVHAVLTGRDIGEVRFGRRLLDR